MSGCLFCNPSFDPSDNLILETGCWIVLLHYDQRYLGRCSVILKRHSESLADLSDKEWLELKTVVNRLEGVFRGCFGATPFNWTCLMNGAYRVKPPAPHVHFHFRPRYKNPVELRGVAFEDKEFADHYEYREPRPLPEDVQVHLVSLLRERLEP